MHIINETKERPRPSGNPRSTQRRLFDRRQRKHDPLLVLSMSRFNFADGWERTFNPIKDHERGI